MYIDLPKIQERAKNKFSKYLLRKPKSSIKSYLNWKRVLFIFLLIPFSLIKVYGIPIIFYFVFILIIRIIFFKLIYFSYSIEKLLPKFLFKIYQFLYIFSLNNVWGSSVYSDWKEGEYQELKNKLYDRLYFIEQELINIIDNPIKNEKYVFDVIDLFRKWYKKHDSFIAIMYPDNIRNLFADYQITLTKYLLKKESLNEILVINTILKDYCFHIVNITEQNADYLKNEKVQICIKQFEDAYKLILKEKSLTKFINSNIFFLRKFYYYLCNTHNRFVLFLIKLFFVSVLFFIGIYIGYFFKIYNYRQEDYITIISTIIGSSFAWEVIDNKLKK